MRSTKILSLVIPVFEWLIVKRSWGFPELSVGGCCCRPRSPSHGIVLLVPRKASAPAYSFASWSSFACCQQGPDAWVKKSHCIMWFLSLLPISVQGQTLWCVMEFVWYSMLIHNVAFLCKRLLRIFKDNGRDHIDKGGVDRRHSLGVYIFRKQE